MVDGKDPRLSRALSGDSGDHLVAEAVTAQTRFRFLVVDDNAVMREMLRDLLETQKGWEVCGESGNAREAIKMALQLKPDLITLDISMPDMNGIEAARELKRLMPSVPVVVITIFHMPHLEDQALDAGVRMLLAKSEPRILIESLRALVAAQTSTRTQPLPPAPGSDSSVG